MEMDQRDSDLEGSMSNAELSEAELGEEDSRDAARAEHEHDQILAKIKQVVYLERDDMPAPVVSASSGGSPLVPGPNFSLPVPFPFAHPPTFLSPASAHPSSYPQPPTVSSASSHSSESSTSSHQTWSFEEQFKQLYEISDDPKRKEFLDDLFSFMQRRGTPINRLPIMAKSVLDLYELYNLVIQRGGLVDVINKKLWQEIIKGLHLPSSITSAAFTLRTQYMKYLYPYECEKRRLSTPGELQAAIDGNRREGRRGSYGTYAEMMGRSPGGGGAANQAAGGPLSLVTAARNAAAAVASINGSGVTPQPANHHHHHLHHHHNNNNHIPHQALLPHNLSGNTGLQSAEFEARMVEYVKLLNKELRTATPPYTRQCSPPSSPPEGNGGALTPGEMSRLTLWNIYGAAGGSPPSEPQKEALNLEKREGSPHPAQPPSKRHLADHDNQDISISNTHIKISSRGDNRGGADNSLVVSMDINGTMYQGVLFAQTRPNRIQS
ncbi:uncharacterized protein isoform X2 [Rhodnius prolixus]|uniref:uncharacterized protein isoform X2 n=1 Tax=Rhodnius prolixus TaxID=13249 RepID=UPI003D18E128